jgi:hypothetical protein
MKNSKKEDFFDNIDFKNLFQYKSVKIILYAGISIIFIYSLGHIFKISAHTIRGYKEFKQAINI